MYVHALRVQLEPELADMDFGVQWRFTDAGVDASLRIRRGIAVPGRFDADADATLSLDQPTWAALYGGATTASQAESAGGLTVTGDRTGLAAFFGAFDHPHLAVSFGV